MLNHMHTYRIFLKLQKYLKTNPDSLPATAINFSMKYIKTQRLFVKKKKKYRMKDGGKKGKREGWSHPELRGIGRTASDSLVNTYYRIQEKNLYLKCFLSTHTHV